jgi:uncharacterized repeat protein (TIGR03837 family)
VTIDLLCKVVDNYGDIGVVYRLARALSALPSPRPSLEPLRLRLIVDDLAAFAAIDPAIDVEAEYQSAHGWEILGWKLPSPGSQGAQAAHDSLRENAPRFVIECFACGRPDWLEDMLFDPAAGVSLIVDLEHLTAEDYAEEFHRMPSLTRSSLVKKAMFLPGFTAQTGGLIIDPAFAAARRRASSEAARAQLRRELLSRVGSPAELSPDLAERFWIAVFSYERDYTRIVADMAALDTLAEKSGGRKVLALVAAGKSQPCFLKAWEEAGRPFPALALPFLPQEDWDEALLACDFSIVRGEDSWSRAALSGRPFLWQAYPQEGRHHLVKVRSFLGRLRPYFEPEDFLVLEALYPAFNDRDVDSAGTRGDESLLPLLARYAAFSPGFMAFSDDCLAHGDLAAGLLTFLREML